MQPKRLVEPWLVRTHFGDMAGYVRQVDGDENLQHFAQDVADVADVPLDAPLWRHGLSSYLHLPEVAELGGLVRSRQENNSSRVPMLGDLPTSKEGLQDLALQLLNNRNA